MLKNPFYYGSFVFPADSGMWYKGAHKPLVKKSIFKTVQENLICPPKAKWGSKNLTFRGIFKCAFCESTITGVEKYRVRQSGKPKRHVYYYCPKTKNSKCKERPIKEKVLIGAINRYISFMNTAHPQIIKPTRILAQGMKSYKKIQEQALLNQNINPKLVKVRFAEYTKHLMLEGTDEEKLEVLKAFRKQLYLHNNEICSAPIK